MKKILFISNVTNRITNFTIPSIIASQELGYEFHLASNQLDFKDDEVSKYNIRMHHIDIARNPFSKKNIIAYRQMLELIKKEKFDVIHCNTPIGGVLGRLCGKKERIPRIIYSAHGFHFYNGAPLINKTIFKWAEMWMARYTDVLITINQEDYKAAQAFKLRKENGVYYVPGVGVNTQFAGKEPINKETLRSSLDIKSDDIVLIAMGDLIERKNYETSIKAIAKAKNPKLKFLICGKGPKLDDLEELVKELHIESQINFLGYRTDINELLRVSDIFLFTTYQEGLPRSMMEAMAAGLPCISSMIRGNIDLIEQGKGGYLRLPNDIEGIAKAINIIATNPALRESMSNYNLERIKRFDIEFVKKEMKKIYEIELQSI